MNYTTLCNYLNQPIVYRKFDWKNIIFILMKITNIKNLAKNRIY
jgi:hypothetical protein